MFDICYTVKCDDVRETETAIGLPMSSTGKYPIAYYVWISNKFIKVQDFGVYYRISLLSSKLPEEFDDAKLITYVPR